jgi:hypothetical protein
LLSSGDLALVRARFDDTSAARTCLAGDEITGDPAAAAVMRIAEGIDLAIVVDVAVAVGPASRALELACAVLTDAFAA